MVVDWTLILESTKDTLLMVTLSTIIAYLIGLPVGVLLYYTSKKGLKPNRYINLVLGTIVNVFRSIPCLLLIIILIPISNIILGQGKWSGYWFSMVIPLIVASFAFIARMVEQSLSEIDGGVIEAAKAMGTPRISIILKVLIPEAMPSLISGFAVTVVSIIGYTSFAGYISGGGLIVEAFNLGYWGTDTKMMWLCILCVVIIVQAIQEGGLYISKLLDKRRK